MKNILSLLFLLLAGIRSKAPKSHLADDPLPPNNALLRAERARDQYQHLISTRNAEVAVIWSRFNVQWLISAASMTILLSDRVLTSRHLTEVVATAGLVFAWIWLWITRLGYTWITTWNEALGKLEEPAGFQPVFSAGTRYRWLPIQIAALIPVGFMVIWLLVLGWAMFR